MLVSDIWPFSLQEGNVYVTLCWFFWSNITFIWCASNQIILCNMSCPSHLMWPYFIASHIKTFSTLCFFTISGSIAQHSIILTFQKPIIFHSIFPRKKTHMVIFQNLSLEINLKVLENTLLQKTRYIITDVMDM